MIIPPIDTPMRAAENPSVGRVGSAISVAPWDAATAVVADRISALEPELRAHWWCA